jgi:hypothetical protein
MTFLARSHGLVVKADGSWPRGCGFKRWHRILDGWKQFASYCIKEKLKIKVAKWGTPKKYFKKVLKFHFTYVTYSRQWVSNDLLKQNLWVPCFRRDTWWSSRGQLPAAWTPTTRRWRCRDPKTKKKQQFIF